MSGAFPIDQLTTGRESSVPVERDEDGGDPTSKAGLMRAAIAEHGAMSASQLQDIAGVKSSGLVMALLKYDIAQGRVNYACGLYTMGEKSRSGITQAIAILKRAGYVVTLSGREV